MVAYTQRRPLRVSKMRHCEKKAHNIQLSKSHCKKEALPAMSFSMPIVRCLQFVDWLRNRRHLSLTVIQYLLEDYFQVRICFWILLIDQFGWPSIESKCTLSKSVNWISWIWGTAVRSLDHYVKLGIIKRLLDWFRYSAHTKFIITNHGNGIILIRHYCHFR